MLSALTSRWLYQVGAPVPGMTDLWQVVREVLPPGADFSRVSASPNSKGQWNALVEVHRYHGESHSTLHMMSLADGWFPSPELALREALLSIHDQCLILRRHSSCTCEVGGYTDVCSVHPDAL